MTPELEPPELRRRFEQPLRSFGLLIGLSALPLLALTGVLDAQAQSSVCHVGVSFLALMLAFRVIGKRELGRLSPFELVTLMLIPEVLSNTVQGQATLLQGLAGLCVLLVLVLSSSLVAHRFPAAQRVLESSPTLLIAAGQLQERNMNLERIAPDELLSEMHKQGIMTLGEVRYAILESSGNITFIPRSPRPAAATSDDRAPT